MSTTYLRRKLFARKTENFDYNNLNQIGTQGIYTPEHYLTTNGNF